MKTTLTDAGDRSVYREPMDDLKLADVNNATAIEQISLLVYQTLVPLQTQQPFWFNDKYRHLPLEQHQATFTTRLEQVLQQTPTPDALLARLKQALQTLLLPGFFESSLYGDLLDRVHLLLLPYCELGPYPGLEVAASPEAPTPASSNKATDTPLEDPTDAKTDPPAPSHAATLTDEDAAQAATAPNVAPLPPEPTEAIAILLLDAENLKLDAKAERLLAGFCRYPICIKIAFANWKSMGKWDIEFHARGYRMIHVPGGKNSADMEMTAVGAALLTQYPTAKEVLVCTADSDLSHLRNQLQRHGLGVYSVRQQDEHVIIINHQTGKIETQKPSSTDSEPTLPALDELLVSLKALLQAECQHTSQVWVKLSRLGMLFQQQHQLTLREVLLTVMPDAKSVKDFLLKHPTKFVVHHPPVATEAYVTLFAAFTPAPPSPSSAPAPVPTLTSQAASTGRDRPPSNPPAPPKINSPATLEAYLLVLFQQVSESSKITAISLEALSGEFKKQYGQSVTWVITEKLQMTGNFVKFLESSKAFKLKKHNQKWLVSLAD